jgi:hypothetical protein
MNPWWSLLIKPFDSMSNPKTRTRNAIPEMT